jgi:hypothetical protein
MPELDKFTQSYIGCALWSSHDSQDPKGGEFLDQNYGIDDLDPAALAEMIADCKKFQGDNADDIATGYDTGEYNRYERAGHDFWLTRNHHGSGFWDTERWPEPAATKLTEAAHACGERHLVVGDDGKVILE